jgi:hypothetical protein
VTRTTGVRDTAPLTYIAYKLKAAVKTLGSRAIDRRTVLGRALTQWRAEIVQALGGLDAVSPQQLAIIDQATTTKLLLDSVNSWLVTQPSLVNARKRSLIPVVQQRQQLADALVRYMSLLGLERRQPDKTLHDYVSEALAEPQAVDTSQSAE